MNNDVKPIKGEYRIRQAGRRRDTSYGSFSRAEAAALRLVDANPDATFIITQEVATVSRRDRVPSDTDAVSWGEKMAADVRASAQRYLTPAQTALFKARLFGDTGGKS